MFNLFSLDYFLTALLNKLTPHNILFDYFFSFLSLKGSSILIWLLVIILVIVLEERRNPGISIRDKKFVALFSVSFFLTIIMSNYILKNIFHRIRPISASLNNFQLFLAKCPTDFSFPSTHAATAFAAATILTFFDKKRGWLYYSVAILISYSRIYLGCHYFLDVLTGGILGYWISSLILRFNRLD